MLEVSKLAYSLEETARAIGCHYNHVRNEIKRGKLRAIKSGTRWLIPAAALNAYLEGAEEPRQARRGA